MLSGILINLIERHQEEIGRRVLQSLRHRPDLVHLATVPDLELRERGEEIFSNLGHWLAHRNDENLAREYEEIGKERFRASVPLHEAVACLLTMKEKMIEFLDEQGTDRDWIALFAEEQFERRIGRFFDLLITHLVRGYETAWRHATLLAA